MTRKTWKELLDFVRVGGLLLISFVFSVAFWLLLFYLVGFIWGLLLVVLHYIYTKVDKLI